MSISFSGSTLTFSDSTTMNTAASLIAGPTGPTGGPGPTGPAGSNASVVTTYNAVGSYVVAFIRSGACFVIFYPGCTVAGACIYRASDAYTGCYSVAHGGSLNSYNVAGDNSLMSNKYNCTGGGGTFTALNLSGTWRSMTTSRQYNDGGYKQMNLFVRVS